MSRELRRVPLDFNAPLNERWKGYLNPHFKHCPEHEKTCFGGATAAAKWLDGLAHLIALMGSEALERDRPKNPNRIYPHPYLETWEQAPRCDVPAHVNDEAHKRFPPKKGDASLDQLHRRVRFVQRWVDENKGCQLLPLTDELATFVKALAGEPNIGSILGPNFEAYKVYAKLVKVAKLPKDWGVCPVCKGEGIDPAAADAYEKWKPTPPPNGPGYQVWETVSEGSPISPVFKTEDEVVKWLVSEGYSEKAARGFVGVGWVPSMIGTSDGKLHKDIEAYDVIDTQQKKVEG